MNGPSQTPQKRWTLACWLLFDLIVGGVIAFIIAFSS